MTSFEPSLPNLRRTPPLSPQFYEADSLQVAKDLLGKFLYYRTQGTELLAEIQEVEAYLAQDPASHSYRGITKRNWPMFEAGGTCYIYLSYGINLCVNIATHQKETGEAILLRALRPVVGLEFFRRRRKHATSDYQLLNGPGKICQAFGFTLKLNGATFFQNDLKVIDLGLAYPSHAIGSSGRIGISRAQEMEYRFFVKGSPWLSRKTA